MTPPRSLPPASWPAVLAAVLLSVFWPSAARAIDLGVGVGLYVERFSMVNDTTYRWTVFGVSYNLRYTSFGTAEGPWEIEPINGLDVIQLSTWNSLRSAKATGDYRRSAEVFPVGPTAYVLVARRVVPTPYVPPPMPLPAVSFVVMEQIDVEGEGAIGLSYHASGLPRGVSCDRDTGAIYGFPERAGTYSVRRWSQRGKARSEAVISTMTISPLPSALTGRYEALLRSSEAEPFAHVSLAVASNGAYSLKVLRPGQRARALKGRFVYVLSAQDLNGNHLSSGQRIGVAYPEPPGLPLSLRYSESGVFRVESDEEAPGGDVQSRRHDGVKLAAFSATQPAPWGGKTYTLALRAENPPASAPAGAGAVSVSANASGVLAFKGRTADGATITGAFAPTGDARFRPFLLPAGQPGAYLAGDLKFRASAGSYIAGAGDADLRWRKPALPKTSYPSGFGTLRVVPKLAPWVPPMSAGLAASLGLAAPASLDLVVTAPAVSNMGANPLDLPVGLLIDTKGRLAGEKADASRVSAKLDLRTGILTGHVLGGTPEAPGTPRKHPFQAALFQPVTPPAALAEGFVLLPSAPAAQARSAAFQILHVP